MSKRYEFAILSDPLTKAPVVITEITLSGDKMADKYKDYLQIEHQEDVSWRVINDYEKPRIPTERSMKPEDIRKKMKEKDSK